MSFMDYALNYKKYLSVQKEALFCCTLSYNKGMEFSKVSDKHYQSASWLCINTANSS